jgi:hypothetical protein
MLIKNNRSGVTLLEMGIVIAIFSLFLVAFYSVLDVGMKMWKIGAVKADVQSTARVVMKKIISELEYSDNMSVQVMTSPEKAVCFETPVYNGEVQRDPNTGDVLWQGYITYFTCDDPGFTPAGTRKILYRRYEPHQKVSPYRTTDRTFATIPSQIIINPLLPAADITAGCTIKKTCDRLSDVEFIQSGSTVNINLTFIDDVRTSKTGRVLFSSSGSDKTGKYSFSYSSSAVPGKGFSLYQ